MLTSDDIQARVQGQPFVPVRIRTSDGQAFDVYHPDLIMIGRRALVIGTASTENPTQFELVARVAIMHVTALEDLPSPTPSAGNGQQ